MNKGRREGQGERANNNKEFSYVFVWCLFRSLIGPKSGQNPKKKKHPNLQPHYFNTIMMQPNSPTVLIFLSFFFFSFFLSLNLTTRMFQVGQARAVFPMTVEVGKALGATLSAKIQKERQDLSPHCSFSVTVCYFFFCDYGLSLSLSFILYLLFF